MNAKGLTKDDSDILGFVVASVFASAIDPGELEQWAELQIAELDPAEIPVYLFELVGFKGPLASLYKVIGFAPEWDRTEEEDLALTGVAVLRGRAPDMEESSAEALDALRANAHIRQLFERTFPFISLKS